MHAISELKAYYDRKLMHIGCLGQEAVGVEREPAKRFAKILPVTYYHAPSSFGISKDYYGSSAHKLGGTG